MTKQRRQRRRNPAITSSERGSPPGPAAGRNVLQDTLRRTRQEAVEQALEQADGNVAAAAAELGILRTSLYRLMKRFGITPPTRAGD